MKLFISYSRQDKHWVYGLHDNLRENPLHTTWIDRDLVASVDWWDTILTNIESCDCFIFVMTLDSLQSEYCVTECEYALALNKPVLPVMLKECIDQIPEEISEIKKRQIENLSSVPPMATVLLKIEQALSQINNDLANGKYEPKHAEHPLAPDDVDDASLIYQGALDDIDRKNYHRAKQRLQSVMDGNDGVFSEMAKSILNDFDLYIERQKMYLSIKLLLAHEDKFEEAQQAWGRFVAIYGTEYDPDKLVLRVNDGDYRIAYYRIMEAIASNRTRLDLSGLKINDLPPEIEQLPDLGVLDLRSTALTVFPPVIASLKNLKQLDLTNTRISKLPPNISKLQNLDTLSLAKTRLNDLPIEIGLLSQLNHLNLSECYLQFLPKEIGQLVNLQHLSLTRNRLTYLPKEIGQLINLQHLFLTRNRLTYLPKEISQLINLVTLHLNDNQITSLPSEIQGLQNLERLFVNNNQLTLLPAQIGNLTKLILAEFTNNQLTSLPIEIGQLTNLVELYLSDNKLENLPTELGIIADLPVFMIKGNPLSKLPSKIVVLKNYQILQWLRQQAREQGLI